MMCHRGKGNEERLTVLVYKQCFHVLPPCSIHTAILSVCAGQLQDGEGELENVWPILCTFFILKEISRDQFLHKSINEINPSPSLRPYSFFVPRIPDVRMFSESPHRNLQAGLNLQTATVQSTELCTVASTVLPQGIVAPDIGYNYTTGNN